MIEFALNVAAGLFVVWVVVVLCAFTCKSKKAHTTRPIDPRKMQKFMGM